MIDLDEALRDHARRWSATAHEPPPLDDAVRSAIHDARPQRARVLAAAAVILIIAAVTVTIVAVRHGHTSPDSQPAVTAPLQQHLRSSNQPSQPAPTPNVKHSATRTPQQFPLGSIKPWPKVTALTMTATDLKRATYWGRKYVLIARATASGARAHTHLVPGGAWPKDIKRVEAIVVSVDDANRLFGQNLRGGALPTARNKVIVLHLVGRFATDGEKSVVGGRLVPARVTIRSILATIGINGGQYDAMSSRTNAQSGPIAGATQLLP